MLAFISAGAGGRSPPAPRQRHAGAPWWRQPVAELKKEIEWLHARSEELVDYLVLPVLQITAAALNFGMVLVASRQVFSLPFKDRSEITQTWHILQTLHMQATPRSRRRYESPAHLARRSPVAVAVISAAVVVSAAAEDNKPPRSTLFVASTPADPSDPPMTTPSRLSPITSTVTCASSAASRSRAISS